MTFDSYSGGSPTILYASADHKRISNLFNVQLGFFMFVGQIPIPLDKWTPHALRSIGCALSHFYCFFMIAQNLLIALLFTKTTFDMFVLGQLNEITDALTMTIIYSFSCYAICYWLWRSRQLLEFLERIDRKYRHHSLAGLTFVSTHAAYLRARTTTLYWLYACIGGVVLWALAPIILRSHTLPLSCWYPFDTLQPVRYEIVYTLQLIGQVNMGATFGNGSALFVSLVIILLAQFDVLYCSLKNLDFHAHLLTDKDLRTLSEMQESLPMARDDELNQYQFCVEHKTDLCVFQHVRHNNGNNNARSFEHALRQALVECVQLHRFILECCNTMEELFNPYCLVKSLQITLQLCLLAFVGVAGERSTVRTINLVQYLALTLCELMMFTYCGELLRRHSIRSDDAFGRSQWWQHANLIRQDILIFLVNSKRAVRITAGKFYTMDVERLRSVVMQAFSFLTLLQKLATKKDK